MRPPPPHGAQSAPWGPRRNGATSAERGPHRASCARWGAIPEVFERGATQPDPGAPTRQPRWGGGGMQRRPNAAGLSPRAVKVEHMENRESVAMTTIADDERIECSGPSDSYRPRASGTSTRSSLYLRAAVCNPSPAAGAWVVVQASGPQQIVVVQAFPPSLRRGTPSRKARRRQACQVRLKADTTDAARHRSPKNAGSVRL